MIVGSPGEIFGRFRAIRTPVGGSKALYASMGVDCPLHHRATDVADLRELSNLFSEKMIYAS